MNVHNEQGNIRMGCKIMMVVLLLCPFLEGLIVASKANIEEVKQYYIKEDVEIFDLMIRNKVEKQQQENVEDQKISDMKQNEFEEQRKENGEDHKTPDTMTSMTQNEVEPQQQEKKNVIHPVIVALYIRYLAFWLAVNFRICTVLLTTIGSLNVTTNCNKKFTKLRNFVTNYHQNEIEDYQKNLEDNGKNTYFGSTTSDIVVTLSKLTLDFVDHESNQTEKKSSSYFKNKRKIFKTKDIVKSCKSIFPSNIDDSIQDKRKPKHVYKKLYKKVHDAINKRKVKQIQKYFSKLIHDKTTVTETIIIEHYSFPTLSLSEKMWKENTNNIKHNGDINDEFQEQFDLIRKWRKMIAEYYNKDHRLNKNK